MDLVLTGYAGLIGVFNAIALFNLVTAPRLKKSSRRESLSTKQKALPLISIIVPMRNEAKNAERIINELLNQDYKNTEIIVVNDGSTDTTWSILQKFEKQAEIKTVRLAEKPEGWIGKSWAVWNGVQYAKGDVLLVIDADVSVKNSGVGLLLGDMTRSGAGVLNCFPRQLALSIGETLTIPLMTWTSAGNLPISLVNKSTSNKIYLSNGQVMMFRRSDYKKVGGHESVKNILNEDSALTKKFKEFGVKVRVVLGDDIITCRMYENYSQAIKGFGRSFVSSLNSIPTFISLITFWIILYFLPYILVFFKSEYIWIIIGISLHRLITSLTNKENPFFNIILHPVQMLILIKISIYSLYLKVFKKIVWKDRPIDQ